MYEVFEFDLVLQRALSRAEKFDDIGLARDAAIEKAAQWCEDEEPSLIRKLEGLYEIYGGKSDFGAVVFYGEAYYDRA